MSPKSNKYFGNLTKVGQKGAGIEPQVPESLITEDDDNSTIVREIARDSISDIYRGRSQRNQELPEEDSAVEKSSKNTSFASTLNKNVKKSKNINILVNSSEPRVKRKIVGIEKGGPRKLLLNEILNKSKQKKLRQQDNSEKSSAKSKKTINSLSSVSVKIKFGLEKSKLLSETFNKRRRYKKIKKANTIQSKNESDSFAHSKMSEGTSQVQPVNLLSSSKLHTPTSESHFDLFSKSNSKNSKNYKNLKNGLLSNPTNNQS